MTESWADILTRYNGLVAAGWSVGSMVQLVEKISSSRYAEGLFAWSSMQDLCIVQTRVEYPYNGPFLRITPIENDKLEFRYEDNQLRDKQWHRTVAGSEGFGRLERFIEQLKWFT